MLHRSSMRALALIALMVGVWFSSPPLHAQEKGKLDIHATFRTTNLQLDVATYTQTGTTIGLLGFTLGSQRNSFAFEFNLWNSLIDLWAKAVKAQASAPPGSWTVVGTMTETGTQDISQLSVSVGAGIRFVISSPQGAGITYVLAKGDFDRFGRALTQVKNLLTK